jgi:hypothetical protein
MSYISAAPQASFNGASPLNRARHYSLMFMRGLVGIMLHQGAWLERLFHKVFTGQDHVATHRSPVVTIPGTVDDKIYVANKKQ